ncbi:phosphate ABC transporter permease subunit PstC [Phytomonospora endophytica]|uniref:Phosphate transport system permease protein n=1 Tax=Phytomonospora endophytica TaxID=714109 RepID=A0A841FF30_9ACTN|nr:phosphate ABC transporter permease subunit PstC [Phytomonospora endophytica]MBB6032448.1 phosphate transport system permease protein [Phytomonospora endophytica]GIG66405.1 phosphate transport system permease protein [Phytomonospora endophytica]
MTTTLSETTTPAGREHDPPDRPRRLAHRAGPADRVFRGVSRAGGLAVLLIMCLVGGFLLYRGWEALHVAGWSFFTTEEWAPEGGDFGIAAVLTGTLLIASVAIGIAVPLAIGTALYISEYAPGRLRRLLVNLVDLMAAVPSVVYGLWGAFLMEGSVLGVARWMSTWLGWLPPFAVEGVDPNDPLASETVYTRSTLLAGLVVAMMVTPIASSVMREVFSQAPVGEREGAYALGATRWGMIRAVVLPFGKGGMIGGTMLGLGRALGETIGVVMTISLVYEIQPHILQAGASSISALIANRYGDASPFAVSALMAAGLALFVLTLIVNLIASTIIARSRSGATGDA